MGQHAHKFTIADDDAVRVLLAKLVKGSGKRRGGINCFVRLTTRLGITRIQTKKCGRHFSMDC